MKVNYIPMRADHRPVYERRGDALVIDGEVFDFTDLPEGGTLPAEAVASECVWGTVARTDGQIEVSLLLTFAAGAPHETRFPTPVVMTGDGEVPQPPYRTELAATAVDTEESST